MSRVPLANASDLPEELRYCLNRPIAILRALGNIPGGLQVHHEFAEWIRWKTSLDPRLRQMLIVVVALSAKNAYEYTHHIALGKQFGMTDEDAANLEALVERGETATFSEPESAALQAALQICSLGDIDDDCWGRLNKNFSLELATEVVIITSFYGYVATVLRVLRIDVEPEFEGYQTERSRSWR